MECGISVSFSLPLGWPTEKNTPLFQRDINGDEKNGNLTLVFKCDTFVNVRYNPFGGENMSPATTVISKALHLKPSERFFVIEALIKSLDNPDPAIDKAWAVEAEKRLKAYKSGKARTVSFEGMFEKHS